MWCPVSGTDSVAPSARAKHSATLVGNRLYLIGGRNGNLPLKDMWTYDIVEGRWAQLQPQGERLPCLQEHTVVAHKDGLYVFGGEVGFSAGTETPLWFYDIKRNHWRKVKSQKGVAVPRGRRGHTALIHRGAMLIYGGYQDLRGSSNELWAFHFETESWHLLSSKTSTGSGRNNNSSDCVPPARHKHSAIIHDDAMWVYGGMTDLQERADLWKWCTLSKTWYPFKTKHNPGPLHSHAACKLPGSMVIFGGESNGQSTNDLWKFNFAVETWEKIQIDGLKPQPRAETVAFAVSELMLKPKVSRNDHPATSAKPPNRMRARASTSADRSMRHSSYLPQNRVTPCEKTYVFQPTTNNYIDGSDDSFHKSLTTNSNTTYRSAQPGSFLREIQKLSQLNLSKLSHNKCSYSVLNSTNNDSTESLLRQHTAGVNEENLSVTPVRSMMVKSQSAHFNNKRRSACVAASPGAVMETYLGASKVPQTTCKPLKEPPRRKFEMTREPISVPNFSTLILPTPVLTPVEAARLVFLDTDDDDDDDDDDPVSNGKPILVRPASKDNTIYENFKPACRDDSYSSHLGAPIYQNIPKSTSVKFQLHPELEEVSDENVSTSDYASIEAVNKLSVSVRPSPLIDGKSEDVRWTLKSKLKTPVADGPFGFSNPNYLGPDIHELLNGGVRHSWNVAETTAQQYAKLLNTPDSGVADVSGRSNSRQLYFMDEMVELSHLDASTECEVAPPAAGLNTKRAPPTSLALNESGHRRVEKSRASSASRAERWRVAPEIVNDTVSIASDVVVPLYVFVVGGKEQGQITVFKRPISIWRLKLY